jgi:hypothetical protein
MTFREFENSVFFQKISELQKPNISETRENEKFGKFCLTQGLIKCCLSCVLMSILMENLWTFWLGIELNIKHDQNVNEVKYLNVPFY